VATAAGQPGVSVVSMSWGFVEGQDVLASDEAQYDGTFTAPGVTFVASTGDFGAAVPQYPAFSPNVVAVGGTTLTLNAKDNSYNTETGWGYYSSAVGAYIASGGGISQYETEPAYQQGIQSLGNRTTPDVSLVADPATGAWVADPYNLPVTKPFEVVGGTSLAAPSWAGLLALVNQGRAAAGKPSLNSVSPTETQQALYSLPQADYHVISSGSNGYQANAGYNLVTGLGTPVANLLVPDLVAYHGPGTSYAGPTVGRLQNWTYTNPGGASGGGPNGVLHKSHFLRVHHAFTVTSTGLADAPDPALSSSVRSPQPVAPAAGTAHGTATTPDLNIPGPATAMPLPAASGPWFMVNGQWPAAGVPTSLQVGPETTLVVQGLARDPGRDLSSPRLDDGRVFDSVLADLVTDADRSRGADVDTTRGERGLPEARDAGDGTGPDAIRSDRIDPTGYARPVGLPVRARPVERGLIQASPISGAVLDELSAEVVGWLGRGAVPGDSTARLVRPRQPGAGLAGLAATLIVAGSWSHRARFRGVTRRQAGRPRYRKDSE
jgi:hypothetical protein